MKAKMPFPASNGQTSRFWRTGDAICQGSVLPKLPICARTNPNRLVIRWMSVQGQPRFRSHRVARSLRGLMAGGSGQTETVSHYSASTHRKARHLGNASCYSPIIAYDQRAQFVVRRRVR